MSSDLSVEERERFLELVRDGANRADAAREIGMTGTAIRSLCRRDEVFAAAYEEAVEQGRELLRDEIRVEYRRRALDPESKSDRLLHYYAVAHLPEFEVFRTQRLEHTGAGGGPLVVEHELGEDTAARLLGRLVERGVIQPGPARLELVEGGGS